MKKFILLAIYILFTVSGQVLFKFGANKNFSIGISNNTFKFSINIISFLGLFIYIISFFIMLYILTKFDLSYIVPICIGIAYIFILLCSYFFLGEALTGNRLIGSLLIIIGLIVMNWQR